MNKLPTPHAPRNDLLTAAVIAALALCASQLVACGGGGGASAVTSNGTGITVTGLSAGAVSGKGSTIVNGVEFDDSRATVTGEDDSSDLLDDKGGAVRKLSGDDVKLGMEVEIEHGAITCPTAGLTVATCDVTPTALATQISFGSNSLVAPISNLIVTPATATTLATYQFTLLGQSVQTTVSTEISLGSPAVALADGVVVEIHGKFDPSTRLTTASRIEVKAATATAYAGAFRLRGVLDLTTTPPTIGGTPVQLTDKQKASVSDGQLVRAKLAVPSNSGVYTVASIKSSHRTLDDQKGHEVELEGVVDTSAAGAITVNGASVSIAPATLGAKALASGARVLVAGTVNSAGTLVATSVTVNNTAPTTVVDKEFLGYSLRATDSNGTDFVNTYKAAEHTFEVWTTSKPYVLRETVVIIQANDPSGAPATVFAGKGGSKPTEQNIAAQTYIAGSGTSFNLLDIFGHRRADGKLVATRIQIQPHKGV